MPSPPRLRSGLLLGALSLSLGLVLAGPELAEACGGMFRSRQIPPEQRPSLSHEKVLLIHDAEQGRQHFVREVAFRRATEPFGFVVPTPTRPEVEAVKVTPFTKLRNNFPFFPRPRGGGGRGAGSGGNLGGGGGVQVLEQKAVGSFTAFVLAATDAEALAKWLADNQLVSSPEADRWLAHYVELGFYYVAMRYDPDRADNPKEGEGGAQAQRPVEAETMRISFDTPLPYYPYLEPEAPAGLPADEGRLMELWYVGTEPVVPVALREQDGQQRWVRPLAPGVESKDARERLEAMFEAELGELLPEGELLVQTFQDQKRVRDGFEDIVFAYAKGRELNTKQRAALEPMLRLLDPRLREPAEDAPAPEVQP